MYEFIMHQKKWCIINCNCILINCQGTFLKLFEMIELGTYFFFVII